MRNRAFNNFFGTGLIVTALVLAASCPTPLALASSSQERYGYGGCHQDDQEHKAIASVVTGWVTSFNKYGDFEWGQCP